jgi:hypothetical protein
MKRRAFLDVATKASLAAVTAATWPQFLRDAFADEPAKGPEPPADPPRPRRDPKLVAEEEKRERLAVLSDGYRRAQKAGKPLLVIVIPDDRAHKWQRGEYFGSFLNHGTAEQLFPLSLCEVICASMSDLRHLVPTVGLGEPLLVLVETDRVPATVRRLEARLPDHRNDPRRSQNMEEFEARTRGENQEIDTRIALLGKLVHDAVAADVAMLEQRAAQVRAALPAASLLPIESALRARDQISPADADRGAALIALFAQQGDKASRGELHKTLARSVEQRLRKQRVPGSHWARHSGCGTTVEGAEDRGPMIACGMGHVPEKSWRFLYFFSVPKHGTLSEF